jgi:hypothetical protein
MCNPEASCSHTISETGEDVAAEKGIENNLREQTKEKPEVLSPQKGSDDFVDIHISISAGNCQGDSRRVEDGVRNKKTSIFSKPKKSSVSTKEFNQFRSDGRLHICWDWPGDSQSLDSGREDKRTRSVSKIKTSQEKKHPDATQPTGIRSALQSIRKRCRRIISDTGRTCSKTIRSLKVPSSWRRGLKRKTDHIRRAIRRTGRTLSKRLWWLKVPPSWRDWLKRRKKRITGAIRRTGRTCRKRLGF